MKVAILTPFYTPVKGGITTYVSNLVNTLYSNYDFKIDIFSRYGSKDKNIKIYNNRLLLIIFIFLNLIKRKYDIVHSHGHWYLLMPCGIYKMMINNKLKIIHTFHTQPEHQLKGLKKIFFEILLSKCNTVTFVSKELEKNIKEYLKIRKSKVIYAGVTKYNINYTDVNNFIELFNLSGCKPIVSFIGPLVYDKKVEGVKLLINSYRRIVEKYPESRLLIIGDGNYKKDLINFTKKCKIMDYVVFTGFMDNVYIPLSVSDIYAHITLQEGLGISILEAMNAGKPVVATAIGGIPEIITDNENGVLINPDSLKISQIIIELFEDKEKSKILVENAQHTIKNKFNWNKIADDFFEIYMEKY